MILSASNLGYSPGYNVLRMSLCAGGEMGKLLGVTAGDNREMGRRKDSRRSNRLRAWCMEEGVRVRIPPMPF